ncbi:type VII secretion integral membrane protein EccD [Solwaraspora sp. WMMB335]|uniref:type VII secretion integral membrane protein EccD n=1 Tax=Solwaraspora sp. WMMB335 TaxID=3404118 RepID=UPI003B93AD6D
MSTQVTGTGEVCRLTVYGPRSRVELAVPAHVPLTDLMPTVLGYLGPELADSGLTHGGWILQRMGEPPLEEDLGTAALGLYDGDILHLRPRNDQLAPVDYDDLADGVAEGIAERGDAWRPRHTHQLVLACAGGLLAVGVAVSAMLAGGLVAVVSGLLAVLGLIGAAAGFVHGYGERGAGAVLAVGAVVQAAVAGLMLPAVESGIAWQPPLSPGGVLGAGGLVAVAALGARAATGALVEPLTGTALAGVLAALTAAFWAVFQDAPAAAALVLPVVLLLGYLAPALAARLARLTVESPVLTADEFQQRLDPVPAADLRRRTAAADAYLTSLYVALGVVAAALMIIIAIESGLSSTLLVIAAGILILLHSRELVAARQRIATFVAGVTGPVALLIGTCLGLAPGWRLTVFWALIWATVLACVLARRLPRQRLLPRWGLLGDITHWVVAASILPLAIAVAGLYARVRGLWL